MKKPKFNRIEKIVIITCMSIMLMWAYLIIK